MKINYLKKENFNLIALAILLFSLKPLEFLAINFSVANFKEDLIYPIIFHLGLFLVYGTFLLLSLRLNNSLLKKFFIFLAATYYLQYFALDIQDLLYFLMPIII
ncbi:hypothetical protein OAB24_04500, partial [Gammaproteobacteria bacterium]|nr:hypothetical protein [Gammaproteobacteria bacterium]